MMGKIKARGIHSIIRDDRASELVEFALSAGVLLMAVFGIMDFSRTIYAYHFVTYAAQEGARYAIVRGADWKTSCSSSPPPNFTLTFDCIAADSDVQNYVRNLTPPGIDLNTVSVTTTWPGTTPGCTKNCSVCATNNSQSCFVKVHVSYPFSFILPFLPKSAISLAATSEKAIQE